MRETSRLRGERDLALCHPPLVSNASRPALAKRTCIDAHPSSSSMGLRSAMALALRRGRAAKAPLGETFDGSLRAPLSVRTSTKGDCDKVDLIRFAK